MFAWVRALLQPSGPQSLHQNRILAITQLDSMKVTPWIGMQLSPMRRHITWHSCRRTHLSPFVLYPVRKRQAPSIPRSTGSRRRRRVIIQTRRCNRGGAIAVSIQGIQKVPVQIVWRQLILRRIRVIQTRPRVFIGKVLVHVW